MARNVLAARLMVDVTTATVAEPRLNLWEIPPELVDSPIPRGEVFFEGLQLIPAKVAIDESLWTLQMTFPRNFVYRLIEAQVVVFADTSVPFTDFGVGMTVLVSTDAPQESDWYFALWNEQYYAGSGNTALQFLFTSADPDYFATFQPQQYIKAPINAGLGAARLFLRWVDITADATLAVTAHYRFRALMFDVEQERKWQMHAPAPIIAA